MKENAAEKKIGYKDVFRQTEYLKMILAALINRFGDSIDAIASTWIVYELTGSAVWSALIFGMNKVPSVLITPLAGAWVEGRRKKTIMVVTDLIRAACVAFVATGYLFGFLQAWMLLITTFTISTAEAFRGPANTALTPRVLKREYYEYGMSLMSTLSSVVELAGTMAAAGIIALIGSSGAIYVDMATFLMSAFIICFVDTNEGELQKQVFHAKEYFSDLKEGFQYTKNQRTVRYLLFIALFLNAVLVPLDSLQAPMANEILHGGAEVLSIFSAATTIGMLFGSFTYPYVKKIVRGKTLTVLCAFAIGAFYLALPLCGPLCQTAVFRYGFTAVSCVVLGYAVAICNSFFNVMFVQCIGENYLARVGGIVSAVSMAAIPVVSFAISAIVAYFSTAQCFLATGAISLVVMAGIWLRKGIETETAQDTDAAEKTGAAEV